MSDLIALRCPSCSGQIQVEGALKKFFCTHCGTQLLLNRSADGMLTPMMARDLTASAKLKESQSTMLVVDMLKKEIAELEKRSLPIRRAFYIACVQHRNVWATNVSSKVLKDFLRDQGLNANTFGQMIAAVFQIDNPEIAGFTSPDELLAIYEYLVENGENDKTARDCITALKPIAQIGPDYLKKKQQLEEAIQKAVSED